MSDPHVELMKGILRGPSWPPQEMAVTLIEPEEEKPEVCPEVHNTTPVDADRAMAAVRAMCAGGGR